MLEYFALPVEQLVDQLGARDAERLGRAVQVGAVAALVLHLGDQDRLAQQRGRARDPVALRQHADDLGMGVLRDLPDQRLAVGLGHPVLGLDLLLGVDPRLEARLQGGAVLRFVAAGSLCRVNQGLAYT